MKELPYAPIEVAGVNAVQLGEDEEVRAGEVLVEPLNGQDVASILEEARGIWNREGLEDHGAAVVVQGGSPRVPGGGIGRVAACDLYPVDISNEAIVVLHAEVQAIEGGAAGYRERDANVCRRIHVVHWGTHIEPNQAAVIRVAVVSNPHRAAKPTPVD